MAGGSPKIAGAVSSAMGVPQRIAGSLPARAAYYVGQGSGQPSAQQQTPANATDLSGFGNMALPRNARNNNFGNIKDGQFAKNQPGYAGTDGTFARFDTPENGAQATKALASYYLRSGRDTPAKFAADWVKGGENTDEDRAMHAAAIAQALGINADSKINRSDPSVLDKIFHAVARREGSDFPEQEARAERASGGRTKINHAAEAGKLVLRAEQAKKTLGKTTEPLLNVPDDHIVKALATANESI